MLHGVNEGHKEYQNQKPENNEASKLEKRYSREGTQSKQVLDRLNKQSSLGLQENIYAVMKTVVDTGRNNSLFSIN